MTDDDVVDVLNDLVETSKDGEYGFRMCAEHCRSPELRAIFERHSAECRAAAQELQTFVAEYGGRPKPGARSAVPCIAAGWQCAARWLSATI